MDDAVLQPALDQPLPARGAVLSVAPELRRVAHINWSGDQGVHVYRWDCVCGFKVSERVEADAAFAARMHRCEGSWCPLPIVEMSRQAGVRFGMRPDWEPTKEERKLWDAAHAARVKVEKELAKAARKAAREARGFHAASP